MSQWYTFKLLENWHLKGYLVFFRYWTDPQKTKNKNYFLKKYRLKAIFLTQTPFPVIKQFNHSCLDYSSSVIFLIILSFSPWHLNLFDQVIKQDKPKPSDLLFSYQTAHRTSLHFFLLGLLNYPMWTGLLDLWMSDLGEY